MGKKYLVITTPTFEKEYKKLKKRFPEIDNDYENLLDEIEYEGDLEDPIPGVVSDGNKVFKKRMKNSSANKGKSGGFRIIEYLLTGENEVYLLDIYSKSDKENVESSKIRSLIRNRRTLP